LTNGARTAVSSPPARSIKRLKYIEAFSAVMRTGSISAAARELGMSQPAVSQLIGNLEQSIGLPLFVRRNGAIFPNSRAEMLHDDALDLLALIDRLEMRLQPRSDKLLSHIRISATMSFIGEVLPLLIDQIRNAHPTASYYVSSHPVDEMTNAVAEGHVDFAFHTRPLEHPNIVNLLQCEVPQVCILRTDHPLAGKDMLDLADLDGNEIIMPSRRDPYYQYYRDLLTRNRLNCRTVVQAPFASFSILMAGVMNALSFNSALMAELACQKQTELTWRPVKGLNAITHFYLSFPVLLQGSETQQLVSKGFSAVTDPVIARLQGK
jgi:molybdate transport repressor ModE-like protein